MERKFKVGDRVRTPFGDIGTIIFVCENKNDPHPYIIEHPDKVSTHFSESDLTLIETERKYQKGDKVWNKILNRVETFYEYIDNDNCIVTFPSWNYQRPLSHIEPYTGQDEKIKKAHEILHNLFSKPNHPYTVILKSGMKVKISATMFDKINEQSDIIGSAMSEEGKFYLHEIAAIVPTENIL